MTTIHVPTKELIMGL